MLLTGLTQAQIKAYRLADNRTHEDAEWDEELLAIELGELDGLGLPHALAFTSPRFPPGCCVGFFEPTTNSINFKGRSLATKTAHKRLKVD